MKRILVLVLVLLGLSCWAQSLSAGPPSPPFSLPDQTSSSGKFLTTDGTNASWGAVSGTVTWTKGTDITAASSINLCPSTGAGNVYDITGDTGITALGTCTAGLTIFVRFTGVPTITHNGTSLIMPGSRSVTAQANDRAVFISLGSGNWYCAQYLKSDGHALGDIPIFTHSATEAATAVSMYKQWHNVTGAYTVTLPAAVVGMSATFNATTAAVFSLDCNVADHFVLAGTALTAGNKITSDGFAGDEVEVVCTAANTWTVRHVSGIFVDGGA